MSTVPIRPWVEVASLHPDVLSENFSEDIFALDLGPLADGNANVPAVYRDPEHFFRASYLTKGLQGLLQDVLSRLDGGAGNRVLKLMTPFGGGKIAHACFALPCGEEPRSTQCHPRRRQFADTGRGSNRCFRRTVFRRDQREADPRRDVPSPHDVGLDRMVPRGHEGLRNPQGPESGPRCARW